MLVELVEPDAAGGAGGMLPIRFTNDLQFRGGALPGSGDIQASGAYHFANTVSDVKSGQHFQQYWAAPLVFNATTGAANFSCNLDGPRPSFEGCVLLGGVNTTANPSQVFMAREGFGGLQLPVTRGGLLIAFDADVHENGGMHLGAMRVGGTDWLWKASPWGSWRFNASWRLLEPGPVNVSVGFLEQDTMDGRFGANASGIHYAGGRAVTDGGENIVYAFHGEGWLNAEANQFLHWHAPSGLFVGQFGQVNKGDAGASSPLYILPGSAGNSFSVSITNDVGPDGRNVTYVYHNDESAHDGVHRWRLDGAESTRLLRATTLRADDAAAAACDTARVVCAAG